MDDDTAEEVGPDAFVASAFLPVGFLAMVLFFFGRAAAGASSVVALVVVLRRLVVVDTIVFIYRR